jgi:DNA-binding beta-propeller fold protein YncE
MTYVVKDRVKVTSTTTGTSTFTLDAAVSGFQSFASIASGSGWNISTAQLLQKFSVNAQDTSSQGLYFRADGLKMYLAGSTGAEVNEYNLSTAWDVRTASFVQNFVVSAQDTTPESVFFKPDGLKMYVVGNDNNSVYEYDLSSAWNISTASYLQAFSVAGQDNQPGGISFKPDGLKMYVVGANPSPASVDEYNLSSAWNISTASHLQGFSVEAQDSVPQGLYFRPDGTKMYVTGSFNDGVYEYNLSSAWNISTASYLQTLSTTSFEITPTGIFFKPDGGKMYVSGASSDNVNEFNLSVNDTYYAITSTTAWEIGIGTLSTDATELFRNTVLESSNSNALVNWGAGSKDVFCTFPADATEGTVPQGDTSQVGTDLVAWTNLKKELDRTVINGVPYNNNNTAGVVSTYSLVYTVSSAYRGGVLDVNGSLNFIPISAAVGQKVSSAGVVSTYSILLSGDANKYSGGVLASNGDIYFVPWVSVTGQKINASGVVSTYSSLNNSYSGGVLDPTGDVHFIPFGAATGQKVSKAGVVSTYSLVYTSGSGAYFGGVLAPNGDIHFVPYSAAVGQKISAAGVVSTYSLVYANTAIAAYAGGVVAANGDVHFIPRSGVVGQKVSLSGTVSTYSLVYTATGAYWGGVLAPNGDIHFVPGSGNRGQKVSATGVVSTYSLAYTIANAYVGGVLMANGEIHFIPFSAAVGQKISTGTQRNIGYCLSPFFNKF